MEITFSNELECILREARNEALRTGWNVIIPDHLMLGMLRSENCEACRLLHVRGIDLETLRRQLDEAVFREEALPCEALDGILPSEQVMTALNMCLIEATRDGVGEAGSIHMLMALCSATDCICRDMLAERGVTRDNIASRNDTPLQMTGEVAGSVEARIRSLAEAAWNLKS